MNNIIIIGGGPSGMMAAISAKLHNNNYEVILIEKNNELGRKLKLTGGGRCNITANVSNSEIINNICKNNKFMYSSLNNFNAQDIIKFFEDNNCPLKEEDHHRMFPKSNKSIDIVNTLYNKMIELNIKIMLNSEVLDITDKYVKLETNKIFYEYLIIATGGIILPNTGSDGKGYEFAKKFNHTITELLPAEVPLVSNSQVIKEKTLQGLSFKDITLNIYYKNKIYKSITHDLIFTHFGLSGPAALRASFDIINLLKKQESVDVKIDFLNNYEFEQLLNTNDLQNIYQQNNLPNRLIKYLETISNNKEELIKNLKAFNINIYTTRGFKSAFVTNGGINLKEVDPKTFKSKLNNKISFCGEILDLNAYTGGYNITMALSSGYTAGKYVKIKGR